MSSLTPKATLNGVIAIASGGGVDYSAIMDGASNPDVTLEAPAGTTTYSSGISLGDVMLDGYTAIANDACRPVKCGKLSLPDATSVGEYAFEYWQFDELETPELQTAGKMAFAYTGKADSPFDVSMPKLQAVPQSMFGASTIKSFSATVATSIDQMAFNGCFNLESVNIPAVESIGQNAFSCTYDNPGNALTEITLPACTSIAMRAFQYRPGLVDLYLPGNTMCVLGSSATGGQGVFTNSGIVGDNGHVHVPQNLLASYQADSKWSAISSKIVAIQE